MRPFSAMSDFSGEPQTIWLTETDQPDRRMKLLQEFWFVDRKGKKWCVPAECVVDGASIPKPLWSLVGSPYTGEYRRASIVHDKACDDAVGNSAARRAADKMFYEACRTGGCSIAESILLYIGVRIGSITTKIAAWQRSAQAEEYDGPRLYSSPSDRRIEADYQLIGESVLSEGETDDPDEIEHRTDRAIATVTGFAPE
jgi:hypothetical protein